MIKIKEAVIVEGKYDKIRLSSLIDALIITTDGFGIFRDKEKMNMLRRLAQTRGLLVITDSDSAGFVIRNHLRSCIPPEQIKHAYIPDVFGKERRKASPSKEGKLGVEGISQQIIEKAIIASGAHCSSEAGIITKSGDITKTDLFIYGLSGGENAAEKRARLKAHLDLPSNMTANLLLDTLNCLMTRDEFIDICEKLFPQES